MLDLEVDWSDDAVGAGQSLPDWTTQSTCIHLAGGRMTSMFDSATYTSGLLSKITEHSFFFSVKFFLYVFFF